MINTFQNYRRHQLRQDERELHLRTIEALSTMRDDEEPSSICSMTDGILRGPSVNRSPSPLSLLHSHRKRILLGILTFIAPFVGLCIGLSGRSVPLMDSRVRLISTILDWKITQLEHLQDHESPSSRALDWILTMDIDWDQTGLLKEKYALATLFFATGDVSWTNHDGWLSLESACSWYGVTCDSHDGVIRRLDLSMNGLKSFIPAEVALLNLESLGLYSNDLIGTIPQELYRMTDLAHLYLDNNHLSGHIDAAIGNLTGLVDLRISGNMLTGVIPEEIQSMGLLEIVYLDANALSGTLPSLALTKLMFLHELQFHDNLVTGTLPQALDRLKMLRVLYCDGNLLFGAIPNGLGQLTRLEAMFLFDNQISGPIPQSFSHLTNLKEFQVHKNQLSGPISEDTVAAWTNLQVLRLHNNLFDGIVPSTLVQLEDLRIVELHGNLFVGTVPISLCNSTALTMLTSDCGDRVQCTCCSRCYHH